MPVYGPSRSTGMRRYPAMAGRAPASVLAMEATHSPAPPAAGSKGSHIWALVLTGIGLFMVTLDNLVVTTALPVIRVDLGASVETLGWVVNAYTLAFSVLLLTGEDGQPFTDLNPTIALCRCGLSANKPFCDGSHSAQGWSSK